MLRYTKDMDRQHLVQLAERLLAGELSPDAFASQVAAHNVPPTASLATASVDLDRHRRCGYPEVVYSAGKSVDSLREIFQALLEHDQNVLATRVSAEKATALQQVFPAAKYNSVAQTFRIGRATSSQGSGTVAIITAGTSDMPVAEEARETLAWMGVPVRMIHDVGVAGPHRLAARLEDFEQAAAIVVVAGMEGALPSVVGGYVSCPVIAVPTSVGYGASLGGIAALLSMLNSCAANVATVNIDAGFKAAYVAGLIASAGRESHDTAR